MASPGLSTGVNLINLVRPYWTSGIMDFDGSKLPDPDELRGLFDVLLEKVPILLHSLADVLFEPERATSYGQAVGNFYKELILAGIAPEEALALTREYLSTMDMKGLAREAAAARKE